MNKKKIDLMQNKVDTYQAIHRGISKKYKKIETLKWP